MASGAQQPSKINVINSSAAVVPNNEAVAKPTFSTMPVGLQRNQPNSVRVPIRPGDLRMPNRPVALRLDPAANNPVRSNMILNVQPRPRFITTPNSRFTTLPGPIHVTQLSGVPASNVAHLGSNWRPGGSSTHILGPQVGVGMRPNAMNIHSTLAHPNIKLRESAQNITRVSESGPGVPVRQQPVAARPGDTGNAIRGQPIIGDSFQAYRSRENEVVIEQEVELDAWAPDIKRQKLSMDAGAYSHLNVNPANGNIRRASTAGYPRLTSTSNEHSHTNLRPANEKAKASRMKPRTSFPSARRASNATDCSESDSYSPSQSQSQSQSQAAAAPFSQTTGTNGTTNAGGSNGPQRNDAAQRRACNCSRSQCLKLYCECFAHSQFCSNCNCVDCHNTVEHQNDRSAAISATLERNPHAFQSKVGTVHGERRHTKGCNCKRSNCLKNYCECYEAKIACTPRCKCCDCQNYRDSQAIDVQYRSARTRRLFNFDRPSQGSSSADPYTASERTAMRSVGAVQSNLTRAPVSSSGRMLSANERNSARMHPSRSREAGFDPNFDFGDVDENEEMEDYLPISAQPMTHTGSASTSAAATVAANNNANQVGAARARDLHILPSDLRVRSIVAREQARNRVLPQELISDEIVEATATCLITRATNSLTNSQDITCDSVKVSETQIERSVLEEFGRCMERLIAIAKQKQENISADLV